MRPSRPMILLAACAAVLGLTLPAAASGPQPAAGALPANATTGALSAKTVAQIAGLSQAKLAPTATQNKIDSRLLTEAQMRRHLLVAAGISHVFTGVKTDSAGLTRVTVSGQV